MLLRYGSNLIKSNEMIEMIFEDRGIKWILGAGITRIEYGKANYENFDGEFKSIEYDFAMLFEHFRDMDLRRLTKAIKILPKNCSKALWLLTPTTLQNLIKNGKSRTCQTYRNPSCSNIFDLGITIAPAHPTSKPRKSPRGTDITPAPPRTGMPSKMTARLVADNIIDSIMKKRNY